MGSAIFFFGETRADMWSMHYCFVDISWVSAMCLEFVIAFHERPKGCVVAFLLNA